MYYKYYKYYKYHNFIGKNKNNSNYISIVANWNPYLIEDMFFFWEENFWLSTLKRVQK